MPRQSCPPKLDIARLIREVAAIDDDDLYEEVAAKIREVLAVYRRHQLDAMAFSLAFAEAFDPDDLDDPEGGDE